MSVSASQIKEQAVRLGIETVGIVHAEALRDESRRLNDWLARGFHGTMAWMARDPNKRADPELLLPGAKSVIVGAVNYFTPHGHEDSPLTGKISRYAWGDDYHDVLRTKFTGLLEWITTEVPGSAGKVCVDTSPVMEKAWAVRAGLGWLGKHSNLITKEFGSWVFLGEILLNLELDCDGEIVPDHCGSCTACIDACPTGAIVEPYVVDSQKCISYATIELRDETLPAEIADNLNGWLYGCDVCQDVCPWNRFESPTNEFGFEPRNGETSLDLETIRLMTHAEYAGRFRGSAMKRAKLDGLKRNASVLRNQISRDK